MMTMLNLPMRRRVGVVAISSINDNNCSMSMHHRCRRPSHQQPHLPRYNTKRRFYHPHETSIDDNDNDNLRDPLTNGGTIVGLWCFHRHGDRAPNRYLGPPQYLTAEASHWASRIPTSSSSTAHDTGEGAHDQLSKYFPPMIHPDQNNGVYLDVGRNPFGYLTYRGMDQMREVGRKFRRRYERFGFRCANVAATTDTATANTADVQYSFLDHWDVKAYSTNYLRTVMSVQCFLDGLISKYPHSINGHDGIYNSNDNNCKRQIYAGGGLKRYYMDIGEYERCVHMDRPTWTTPADMTQTSTRRGNGTFIIATTADDDHDRIPVQVRDKEMDTLNMFDKYPEMMNGLVKDVIATERFQRLVSPFVRAWVGITTCTVLF